jgi:hypothetical protein
LRRPSWLLVLAGSPGCSPAAGFRSWLLLPSGEKVGMRGGSCAALYLGHGFLCWFGREVARLRRAFGRLPAPEFLLFAGPRHRLERWRTAQPARRAEGRMPGVKRRNQEKWPYRARRPYKPWRLRFFGTGVAPPVRPSATPRRRRLLRAGRGCRELPRFARSNVAKPLHACLSAHTPHRHSGAGRNPVASAGGRRENLPLLLLDSGLRRSKYPPAKPGALTV